MIITRNGIEIELTADELRNASYEYDKMYHIVDIQDVYEWIYKKECPYTKTELNNLADTLVDNLADDDNYGDAFRYVVEYTIKIKERTI